MGIGSREEIFFCSEALTSSFRLIPPTFGEVIVTSCGLTANHEDCQTKGLEEDSCDRQIQTTWNRSLLLMENNNATVTHVGVGLDTARYGHHATFLDDKRQMATAPFDFAESQDGYEKLRKTMLELANSHGRVRFHIRIDAAGQYAMNLENFLYSLPWDKTISVGEPKRNKDYKNVHFPKRKADSVDSHACARFAIVERPLATPRTPAEFHQLRELSGACESQCKRTTRLINQLHNRLSRVFPELAVLANDLSAAWVLTMLRKYPTAQRIAAARIASLLTIPHIDQERVKKLQQAARNTTGSLNGPLIEETVRALVDEITNSQKVEKKLEKLLLEAFDVLPAVGQQQLLSIPGIGKKTAAALVGKIVSIDRFETPEALVNYFGVFPEENTSGVDKRGNPVPKGDQRMSTKGNDLVRGLLYMACQSAIQWNPVISGLYARQRQKGKRGDVALGHCMRKMLHLAFALWKTNQPFDPQYALLTASQDPLPETAEENADPASSAHEKTAGRKGQSPRNQAVTAAALSIEPTSTSVKQSVLTRIEFSELRNQVTIEQVLSHLGLLDHLRGSSTQRRGPCPIHDEHRSQSRSFSVNLQKHVFRCFHPPCGAQGNVLDLWAAVHQLSLREAALLLAETFQLRISSNREEEPVLLLHPK